MRPASVEPAGGVAVVELFTSEGCSSCPPADAVLRDLAARADETGEPIYALSFHVDYWDRLGWADPYADAAHTARQRATAAAGGFDAGRVFTPAMIVGGADGFVGSNRRTAEARVAEALATPPPATVRLSARGEGGAVSVGYAVEGAPDGGAAPPRARPGRGGPGRDAGREPGPPAGPRPRRPRVRDRRGGAGHGDAGRPGGPGPE